MRCRAVVVVVAGLCTFTACERGGADRRPRSSPVIRVAVADEIDRSAIESQGQGAVRHLLDLLSDDAGAALAITGRHDREVTMRLRRSSDRAVDIARRLGFPGLVSARAEGRTVIATFRTPADAQRFFPELANLEGGTHVLAETGLVLEPRPGKGSVRLELVPAPRERHWRLLNGGHVDLVPMLRPHEASKLARLSSVATVKLPATSYAVLMFGDSLDGAPGAILDALDLDTVASTTCGDCRARLPIDTSEPPGGEPPKSVELIYLARADTEAIGARIIAHQLLEHGVDARLVPLAFEDYNRRTVSWDFELALGIAPMSVELFDKYLEMLVVPEADVSRRLAPLWVHQLYAAYDTSVCGVEPDSGIAWRWLADARPCEGDR